MPTFYEYMIEHYLGKHNKFGDLAGDMKFDKDFPKDSKDRKTIKNYLLSCRACEDCMLTFKAAWTSYKRQLRKLDRSEVSIC